MVEFFVRVGITGVLILFGLVFSMMGIDEMKDDVKETDRMKKIHRYCNLGAWASGIVVFLSMIGIVWTITAP